jgi:hypothetical protein
MLELIILMLVTWKILFVGIKRRRSNVQRQQEDFVEHCGVFLSVIVGRQLILVMQLMRV